MTDQELLLNVISEQNTRVIYLEQDFYNFFLYYFQKHIKFPELAPFHKDWCISAQKWLNLYVEWHRESAKTTILWMAFEIWKICYEKTDFICNLCYDKDKAKSFNKLIAQELIHNNLIEEDFWVLFSKKSSDYEDDDISEKGISEFVTTNYIKVKAFWMWEALRWEIFNSKLKWNVRPTHILFDDLDNDKNTKNLRIIKADMDFLNWEVIWWLDKTCWQIIWLWNVIRKDWRNVRKKQEAVNNPNWIVYSNFIYWPAWTKSWTILWNRYVETDKEAEEINKDNIWTSNVISLDAIRREEKSNFDQNILWIPLIRGQTIVRDEWINYTQEQIDFDFVQIWIDPAFSLKTWSDAIGIAVTGFKTINNITYRYWLYCKKLEWSQKDEDIAEKIITSLYIKYNAIRVLIEKNNGWELFARVLQKKRFKNKDWEEIWMAIEVVNATKDKLTRFKEYEWELMRWQILFYPDCSDWVNELLDFTGDEWWVDNLVDAWVWSWKEYEHKEFYISVN